MRIKCRSRKNLTFFMLLIALLIAIPVQADGPGDVVIYGDDYTLEKDQVIKGDLFVYGGNVTLEKDSQVKGDVHVFGGNLNVDGEIGGDVTVWGGNINLQSNTLVRGDLKVFGGTITREKGADVRGNEIHNWLSAPQMPRVPRSRVFPQTRDNRSWSVLNNLFRGVMSILVITVLGILVVVFIPRHTDTVAEAMIKAPVQSLGSGLITTIAVPIAALIMAITLILIPASILLLLLAGIGSLFGWIAAGLLFGTKLLRALNKSDANSVVAVALGLPILSVVGMVPCIGWIFNLLVWMWGLGAVVYTLFGTRAYNEPMPQFTPRSAGYDPRMDRL